MEQKTTVIQCELDGTEICITQSNGRGNRRQAHIHSVLRRTGRLKASVERALHQQIEHQQSYLHDYLIAALAALESVIATLYDRLDRTIAGDGPHHTEGLRASVGATIGHRVPTPIAG